MKEFFEVLFNSGEGVCTGNAYAVEVSKYPKEGEFFCVNPLDAHRDHAFFLGDNYNEYSPRRADLNVTCFRNLIFEMDSLPLDDQLRIFRNSDIPFTSIVYSGGKSYHAVLSVEGGVCGDTHTLSGVDTYKNIWSRLAAKLDKEAVKLGYSYPDGKSSFIDHACKNPSRLTRYPGMVRSNGNVQQLVQLTERMDKEEFLELLDKCPKILTMTKQKFDAPEDELQTVELFKSVCPPELYRKLTIIDWAGSEGMYPYLLRYTLWAIDSTNVCKDAFLDFLNEYTFGSLVKRGYPLYKLSTAVDHAYRMKGK